MVGAVLDVVDLYGSANRFFFRRIEDELRGEDPKGLNRLAREQIKKKVVS